MILMNVREINRMAEPIKGLSDEATEFCTCLILHMLLPLLPLVIEAWKTNGDPTDVTLAITTSMYSISIGLSSRNKGIFSLCFFISILFSMAFGLLIGGVMVLVFIQTFSISTISSIFILHACERYNRHVVEIVPFWQFKGRNTHE